MRFFLFLTNIKSGETFFKVINRSLEYSKVAQMKHSVFILSALLLLSCGSRQEKKTKSLDYAAFANSLDSIMEVDQGIRILFSEAMKSGNEVPDSLFEKMDIIDASNQAWVKSRLEEYGWPEKSKIGENAALALFLVIQHAELNDIETYYPQLQQLADMGEAHPAHAAMMLDRMLMYQGKKQVYGTQASGLLRADGSFVIWPIENPESVNERRIKAGFPNSVEDYAASLEAFYDPMELLPENEKQD